MNRHSRHSAGQKGCQTVSRKFLMGFLLVREVLPRQFLTYSIVKSTGRVGLN